MLTTEKIDRIKSQIFRKIQFDYGQSYNEKKNGPKISLNDIYIGEFIKGVAIVYIKWPISEWNIPCDYEGSLEEYNINREFPRCQKDSGHFLVNEDGNFISVKICDSYYSGLEQEAKEGITALRTKFIRIYEESGNPTEYIIYQTGLYKANGLWDKYYEYRYHDFYIPKEDDVDEDNCLYYEDDENKDPEMSTYQCIRRQEERLKRYAAIINHKNEIVYEGTVAIYLDNILHSHKYLLTKEQIYFPAEICGQIYQQFKYNDNLYTDIVSEHLGVFDFSQKKEIIACRFKRIDIKFGTITTYTYSDVCLNKGIRYSRDVHTGEELYYSPSMDYHEYKCQCVVPNDGFGKGQQLSTQYYLIRHGKYAGWFLKELASEQFKTLLHYGWNRYIHICKVSDLELIDEEKDKLCNIMDLHLEYNDIESSTESVVPTDDYDEIYPCHECKHQSMSIDEIISEDYKYICMLINFHRLRILPQAFREMCITHYKENDFLRKLKKVYECMVNRDEAEEQEMEEYYDRCSSYQPDINYEEETYYALGGSDYNEWRENGGNLDDMMDGMGL